MGVLICDQSAAFDVCDHHLLLEKLKLLGLEEKAASWVKSYLSNRKQSCFVDGYMSSPLDLMPCGVPQGSIGGPLLWLCFTCDQPDIVHEHPIQRADPNRGCSSKKDILTPGASGDCGMLVGYVDDGAYSYANKDPDILSNVLTRKYNLMEEWLNGNKLVINPDKTHLMVMCSAKMSNKRNQASIQAGQFTIKPTTSEKLLGCILHQSLSWNEHVRDSKSSLMKQLTARLIGIKKVSANASFKTKLMVANGIYMSKLVYLIAVWGGAKKYLLRSLQVQQLAVARVVCGFSSNWWSRQQILNKVGWLSVNQLVIYNTVLQAHKTISTGKPAPLFKSISTEHPYPTRRASHGCIWFGDNFQVASRLSKESFRYRAAQWFNAVPVEVRTGTLATVKKKLKSWVKQNVPFE